MNNSTNAVVVKNICKRFGEVRVLDNLSFSLPSGTVTGFIGENGAGKTTTMRMIATLDVPDSGHIEIAGRNFIQDIKVIRPLLGWMPDSYDKYPLMTVSDYLDFFGRAYGYKGKVLRQRISEVVEFCELGELRNRDIDVLSKGQSQRICLARTLLNDPSILILDEPAAGLDPKARVEFKHLVRNLAQLGKTLFISSHILSELEDMCSNLIFLKNGKILHEGSAESLKTGSDMECVYEVNFVAEKEKFIEWIELQPNISMVEDTKKGAKIKVKSVSDTEVAQLLRRLVLEGFQITEFRKQERRLEDAFIELVTRN
jgi:ABC-2 type transport system ATP-binding protein